MIADYLVVFAMIVLHAPDGREIDISIDEITAIHCKVPNKQNALFAAGVNAVISTTDGKNVSVAETCMQIREALKETQK